MYQLIMTLLWFINGQGDIILIDLCRQDATDLCMIIAVKQTTIDHNRVLQILYTVPLCTFENF